MKKLLVLALSLVSIFAVAQNKQALKYANLIDTTRIKSNIYILSSEKFEGRKVGAEGQVLTENYLEDRLSEFQVLPGIDSTYKQNIGTSKRVKANKSFVVDSSNYKDHYRYLNGKNQDSIIEGNQIVFAGFGIHDDSYNDFEGIDIKNKIVLYLKGPGPVNEFGIKQHKANSVPSKEYFKNEQPKAIIEIIDGFSPMSSYGSESLIYEGRGTINDYLPSLTINELLANRILSITGKTVKQLRY